MAIEIYSYQTEDGIDIVLPLKFKTKILRQAASLDEVEFMFYMLDNVADEANVLLIDEMDVVDFGKMFKGWQAAWQARAEATSGE